MLETLFVGQDFVHLQECESTNDELRNYIANSKPNEGFVVISDYQTAGRGQIGNVWDSQRGFNLLMSVYFKPNFLDTSQHFLFNEAMALGVCEGLNSLLSEHCFVKWPNDIICKHQKICGILIENSMMSDKIESSIVGIGININQSNFTENVKATSMSIVDGFLYDRKKVSEVIFYYIEKYYLLLKSKKYTQMSEWYHKSLYKNDSNYIFIENNKVIKSEFIGISDQGELMLLYDKNIKKFKPKEIRQWLGKEDTLPQ